jgi:hypothetical protein
MGSLIKELRRRRALRGPRRTGCAAASRSFRGNLARAEEQASRLAIACEEVTRVMEEPAAADPPARQNGRSAGKAKPVSRVGAVTVPPWQEGAEASVLPRLHQDLLEVAADAGRPLRAMDIRGRGRNGFSPGARAHATLLRSGQAALPVPCSMPVSNDLGDPLVRRCVA